VYKRQGYDRAIKRREVKDWKTIIGKGIKNVENREAL